jgi:hypothetical protein
MRLRALVAGAVIMVLAEILFASEPADWRTTCEKSNYTQTGPYAEAVDFCRQIATANHKAEYHSFGSSAEGRELPLLLVNPEGGPELPLVLIIAGAHAGEIDCKDAGLMLLRDALVLGKLPGLLDRVRVAFIPILNVDGHERISAFNRPNQNGPTEMGWRTTADNLNLNRDWLKADTPEMRALLSQMDRWQPDLLVDLHVTDGADYQYVLTYSMNEHENDLLPLRRYNRDEFLPQIKRKLKDAGYDFVPQVFFRDGKNMESGWESPTFEPRFSTGYGTIIGRPSLLIETHSLKDYRTRVTATYEALKAVLQTISNQAQELRAAERKADSAAASLPGKRYYLNWAVAHDSTVVDFAGLDFHRVYSSALGDSIIRWGHEPRTYHIPFFGQSVPTDSVVVPQAYLIPAGWMAKMQPVLERHGVRVTLLPRALDIECGTYLFEKVEWAKKPYEGRLRPAMKAKPVQRTLHFAAGSGLVVLRQPRAQVAIHLLEPGGPDSFVHWGFMNAIFEQKEYAESYIMDTVAARMLRESPVLEAEFRARLADSSFAASPEQRLEFFYEHSPYWDAHKDVYPVGRVTDKSDFEMIMTLLRK